MCLTCVIWVQLGELRRLSMGDSSERGRLGMAAGALGGGCMLAVFVRRRGCT